MTTAAPAPAPVTCRSCQAGLSAGARYCHRCGRATTSLDSRERAPWLIAWALVVLSVGGIAWFVLSANSTPTRPDMANVGAEAGGGGSPGAGNRPGTPPDISQMTPRDRFLRLHDRVLGAFGSGDTATAQRFAPMALAAYDMLERPDPDLRFHAGAILVRLGRYPEALALADTIQAEAPEHLFGDLLRADVARARNDRPALDRSRRAFLAHLDRQLASGRPEYEEHRALIDEFRKEAGQ